MDFKIFLPKLSPKSRFIDLPKSNHQPVDQPLITPPSSYSFDYPAEGTLYRIGCKLNPAFPLKPISKNQKSILRKLNTNYVDILVPPMHDVKSISNPELPEEFEKLKKTGKIRFSGFACHKNEKDVMMKAVKLGYFDVMLVRYNLENKDGLDLILTLAKEKQNIGFMAMKVTKQLARRRKAEIPAEPLPKAISNTVEPL